MKSRFVGEIYKSGSNDCKLANKNQPKNKINKQINKKQ